MAIKISAFKARNVCNYKIIRSPLNFSYKFSQELPASATLTCCGWVNKYCFIHSLVSCPVNLSRSLFLHNGVTDEEEEETSFYCCLCNLSPTFQVPMDSCPRVSLLRCQVSSADSPISAVLCCAFLPNPEIISLHLLGHSISDFSILLLNTVSSVGYVHVTFFSTPQEHTCLFCSAV